MEWRKNVLTISAGAAAPWFHHLDGGLNFRFHKRNLTVSTGHDCQFPDGSQPTSMRAGWMRPSLWKALHCPLGNFTTDRIKPWQGHHLWRIIDNHIDTCQALKGTNIAPFTTDNPTLRFIVWPNEPLSLFCSTTKITAIRCIACTRMSFCDFIRTFFHFNSASRIREAISLVIFRLTQSNVTLLLDLEQRHVQFFYSCVQALPAVVPRINVFSSICKTLSLCSKGYSLLVKMSSLRSRLLARSAKQLSGSSILVVLTNSSIDLFVFHKLLLASKCFFFKWTDSYFAFF